MCVGVVLEWCYSGVIVVLWWCYTVVTWLLCCCYTLITLVTMLLHEEGESISGSPARVLQLYYSGFTVVLRWCDSGFTVYSGVIVVFQWCSSGVIEGIIVVLQWCCSGATVVHLFNTMLTPF
jgi:hypothetical protein